jgi:aminoglycoside phosphotransferase (APT) family kinase protein
LSSNPDDSDVTNNTDGRDLTAPSGVHGIDASALAAYLQAQIPGFGASCTVQQFRGGQSNPTYLVQSGDEKYVLRKKPPGKLLPSAHAVDREFRVIAALENSDVPVPQALHLCEDETVIGQVFYVMRYVGGRVFSDITLSGCEPAGRTTAYMAAAGVLSRLHAVDYAAAGLTSFGKPDNYVARQLARWSKQYELSRTEECPAMDRLIASLQANDPGDDRAAIVHGDYRPGNLIFNHDDLSVAAVLDWELSTIGSPMADLGYFLLPFHLDERVVGHSLRGHDLDALGIPGEQALLDAYQANGAKVENIDYYIAFSLFRLAAILAGVLRRGLDGNASDPGAVERGRAYALFAASGVRIMSGSRG